jgi:undecaprenyl-diphosphatase
MRFSFLLAAPIIFAAGVLKLPELLIKGNNYPATQIIVGAIVAAIFAYLSVKFLSKYFETKKLAPFAVYCVAIGIVSLIILSTR